MTKEMPTYIDDNARRRRILFCPTRAECETVSEMLNESIPSCFYDGGMNRPLRLEAERGWRRGEILVMCDTSAFGVGIDYSDVSVVMHLGHFNSILNYSQESGRCGRGGRLGLCMVISDDHYSATKIGVSPADLDPCSVPYNGRNEKITGNLLEVFKFVKLQADDEEFCR